MLQKSRRVVVELPATPQADLWMSRRGSVFLVYARAEGLFFGGLGKSGRSRLECTMTGRTVCGGQCRTMGHIESSACTSGIMFHDLALFRRRRTFGCVVAVVALPRLMAPKMPYSHVDVL